MADVGSELAELRRRAYSRSGTDDDRRRLAELESSIATTAEPPDTTVEGFVDQDDSPPAAVEADEPSAPRPRVPTWLAAGAGGAVGAVIATAVTLAIVASGDRAPETEPATALAVFEREASAIDDPTNLIAPLDEFFRDAEGSTLGDVEDLTLRWVGAPAGNDVYAVRWHRAGVYTVCLIVESAPTGVTECMPEVLFVETGLNVSAFGVDLKWGPSDPAVWVNSLR
jgi:hypothetical protein